MTNNMNVKLKIEATGKVLDIDDNGGGNRVGKSPNPQTISWNLTGNELAQAEFVPMSDSAPGFEFDPGQQIPSGVFVLPPQIGSNGKSLNLVVNHPTATSNGSWIYILRVKTPDGTVYKTTHDLGPTSTSKNPIIINE